MEIKRDRHYYAIEIVSGNSVKFGSTAVSLTAGTYWTHNDASINSTYPSFYIMLKAAMTAAFAGTTWEVYPITPAGYKLRSGVRLKKLSGTTPGSLNLSDTSGVVKRLLGFKESDTGTRAFISDSIDGEIAAYGSWSPWSLFEGRAEIKDSHLQRVSAWSSDQPEVATAIIWRERNYRLLRYPYVYGCYVNNTRASFQYLAQNAGMSVLDYNNALTNLWSVAGRNNSNIIVCYDMDDLDLSVTTHDYEYVRFADQKVTTSMDNISSRTEIANDLWTVTIPYIILGGSGYGL